MFGKLYRREFLEKYKIRFNTSLSNEDTGFNCVVKGCSDKIWYIPKDVYIWHFKANSITRIKQGMYGQDSGYKGYLDNMVWQILELQKRFVNKNYILSEIVSIMCVLYHFHVENMQQCPLNTNVSMNWIRGYYALVYQPYEELISEDMFMRTFAQVAAGQNIAAKGIIPKMTIFEFMKQVRAEPYKNDINEEIRGSTPAGYVPPITDPNWPVQVTEYNTMVEGMVNVDSDTNFSRYGGMKEVLGIPKTDKDYDIHYDGSEGKAPDNIDMLKEQIERQGISINDDKFHCVNPCTTESNAADIATVYDKLETMPITCTGDYPAAQLYAGESNESETALSSCPADWGIKERKNYEVEASERSTSGVEIDGARIDAFNHDESCECESCIDIALIDSAAACDPDRICKGKKTVKECHGIANSATSAEIMSTSVKETEAVTPTHEVTTSSRFVPYNPNETQK